MVRGTSLQGVKTSNAASLIKLWRDRQHAATPYRIRLALKCRARCSAKNAHEFFIALAMYTRVCAKSQPPRHIVALMKMLALAVSCCDIGDFACASCADKREDARRNYDVLEGTVGRPK